MEKKIDLKLSIFELVQKYPELLNVMVELGFKTSNATFGWKTHDHSKRSKNEIYFHG